MQGSLFHSFRRIAYEKAGIDLGVDKEVLVSSRVGRRIRELGLRSEREYLRLLEEDQDEAVAFIDVISTNFTSFFREPDHFELLRSAAIARATEGIRSFRVWCAAASSGEEPYTIAIVLAELLGESPVDYRILATDISTKVLARARAGVYSVTETKSVPKHLLAKYFRPAVGQKEDKRYEVSEQLKARICFERLNLAEPPFPMKGPLDIVMCRNVMIYFDNRVRQALVAEVERLLRPGAILMIGHSETLNGLQTGLRMTRPSVFEKAGV